VTLRVLYVNHTSVMSGAEASLLVLLQALGDTVSPVVACPPGPLAGAVGKLGIEVRPVPGTDLSARLHPVHTTEHTLRAARAAQSVRTIARGVRADIVHANTPRAGLISLLATGAGGAGPVVHVRDSVPPGRLPQAMFRLLATRAAAYLPTSRYLRDQLPAGIPAPVVANVIDPAPFDAAALDRRSARARLGLGEAEPVLAVIGQISPHKGQSDAIRALATVREAHPDARLLLAGSVKFAGRATRFDNRAYREDLTRLAHRLRVADAALFLGERGDIAEILSAVDVLLVPSWYEPFGRVALEAMTMRVPVIATSVGGISEVIDDGVDGLVLPPRDPGAWARAIDELLSDGERRARMGARGRKKAEREFSARRHASEIMEVYRLATAPRRPLSAGRARHG
jgi:glycosyltransferase involved in cell wall biosynthesis